jgi:hypothetical protein
VQLSDAAFLATGLPSGVLTVRHFDVKGKGTMQTHVLEAGTSAASEVLELLSLEAHISTPKDGGAASGGALGLTPAQAQHRRVPTPRNSHTERVSRTSRVGMSVTDGGRAHRSPRVSHSRASGVLLPRGSAGEAPFSPRKPGGGGGGDTPAARNARVLRAALLCGAPALAALAPAAAALRLLPASLLAALGAPLPPPAPLPTLLFAPAVAPLTATVCGVYAALLALALSPAAALPHALTARLHTLALAAHAAATCLAVPLLLAQHVAGARIGDADAPPHMRACVSAFFWSAYLPGITLAWLSDVFPPYAVSFALQALAGVAYVASACAAASSVGALTPAFAALALAQSALAHALVVPTALMWALDASITSGGVAARAFGQLDTCGPSAFLRRVRSAARALAHRARVAAGWHDLGRCPLDGAAASALVLSAALARLARAATASSSGGDSSYSSTVAALLITSAASRTWQRRPAASHAGAGGGAGSTGGSMHGGLRSATPGRTPNGSMDEARGHMDERERALAVLRHALTHASNEEAILRAGATALAALFPDGGCGASVGDEDALDEEPRAAAAGAHGRPRSTAFALATFAEGSGVDVVASQLVVCADEKARRALAAALPANVGAWAPSHPSSVAVTCGPGSRLAALDSRDTAAGIGTFCDWQAAVDGGLNTRVAITVPLTAGPVVVGFVQLHRCGASNASMESRVSDHSTLREFCDAIGSSLFVRRAFALNRGSVASRGTPGGASAAGLRHGGGSSGTSRMPLLAEEAAPRRRSSESAWPASNRTSVTTPTVDLEAWASLTARAEEDKATLLDWNLDPWALPDDEVERLIVVMLHSLGLLRTFSISPTVCAKFVADCASHYSACPFHNFRHAALVVLASWRFIVCGSLAAPAGVVAPLLTPLDCMALLLSALCHDLEVRPALLRTRPSRCRPCASLSRTHTPVSLRPRARPFAAPGHHQRVPGQLRHAAGAAVQRRERAGEPPRRHGLCAHGRQRAAQRPHARRAQDAAQDGHHRHPGHRCASCGSSFCERLFCYVPTQLPSLASGSNAKTHRARRCRCTRTC